MFALSLCAASLVYGAAPSWPEATREAKPWVYNWCMGSAMDEPGLEYQSRELAEKGFGGFHVIPIYGARGYEAKWKKYLSPEWMDAFALARRIGEKHGLGIDLTSGTGWCFGGPWLKKEEGSWKLVFDKEGRLVPQLTGQQVKRAAPGGEGPMMNPFSPGAMDSFLKKFEVFDKPGAALPEHFYHDSYEYFNAEWSPELPAAFKKRRGYDLMEKWDIFSGKGDSNEIARVKCDYRQTIDDLMVEEVFPKWVEWCHKRGVKTRNEAHGSPANWLDLYALADVPETEMFGSFRDILISKFASSAANVTRKRFVSAETCTWIAEHFHETLAETKVFIDKLFLAGVNRIFFQGCAYSPVEAPWPGWCFYASMQMNPRNPIWRDVGTLTAYITRCQSVFQSCEPDNDVLVYWPLRDYWWNADGYAKMMGVDGKGWFYGQPICSMAGRLHKEGYAFDYVSDRMLQDAEGLDLRNRYAALAVPECRHMPEKTKAAIAALGLPDVSKARREPFAAAGLMFTRFRKGADTVYFLVNQTDGGISRAFAPSCRPKSAWLMNPLTGGITPVEVKDGRISISLDVGHSCFLWCSPQAAESSAACASSEKTYLDLGEVIGNESVRVTVNGTYLGTLIMPPYRIEVPQGVLKSDKVEDNDIVVDVCERAANRIREMDLKGVKWKTFSDINMVDIHYRPFDASKWSIMPHGVRGPMRIYRGEPPEPLPAAARPAPRPQSAQHPRWAGPGFWGRRHKAKLAEIATGPKEYDCVFVGDSITHNWEGWDEKPDVEVAERLYANGGLKFPNGPGRAVWAEMKKTWRVLNLGMAGDTTQNVLWRLDNGEMDGYRARFVFVMIGTNNGSDTPENRAKGIKAVLDKISEKQPQATILLSPIFPSGAKPNDPLRVTKDKTNAIIKGYADGKRVVWVDFNKRFLNADGTLNTTLMPDLLHPLEDGYRIWFDAIKEFRPSLPKNDETSPFHATIDVMLAERVAEAPCGDADFSAELQSMLDDVGSRGGGTVFLRRGFYTIAHPVEIPVGVTLRGDYSATSPNQSTVLCVFCGRGEPGGTAAFTVNCGGGLMGLVFWYPEQTLDNPVPYPWTAKSKIDSSLMNENQTVTDCTFVNSWKAVAIGPEWNELHTLRRLSICALSTGIAVDRTTDIGRTSEVLVSPKAWSDSGLPGAPSENELREWLRTHETVGADYGRSDWEYIWRLKVDGYNVGARFRKGATPQLTNAAIADSTFTNCVTGIRLEMLNPVGLAVHDSTFASDTNVVFTALWHSSCAQFNSCTFVGLAPEQPMREGSEWGGHLVLPHAQASRFPVRPEPPPRPRPAGDFVQNVRDFGAATNLEDNTAAFMRALSEAGRKGGTVYVPAGVWKIRGSLRVPSGVELRGCSDVPHHTVSGGSVLLAYSGRGDEEATPLISLEPRSGLRGLGVWYPEQMFYDPVPYPWAVRALGEGCWIADVNIANCWNGVDFASHPSGGHIISYLSGGFWRRGLAVGKSASRGWIEDIMMNTHYTTRRRQGVPYGWGESKDVRFCRMPPGDERLSAWQREHLEAYTFADCADEHVRGIFAFAARTGVRIEGRSNVRMLLPGCDTVVKCFSVRQDAGSELDVALAQLVPWQNGIDDSVSIMLEPGDAGESRFMSTQTWTSRTLAERGAASFAVQRGDGRAAVDTFVSNGVGKSYAGSGRLAVRNGMYIDYGSEFARPSNASFAVSECSVGQFGKGRWHGHAAELPGKD